MLDLYTDYLISSTGQANATGLSRLVDSTISHDRISRFLQRSDFDSKTLWQTVKPLVREHQSCEGCLVFDDCIIEKPHMDENDLISWHYDHSKGRSVKGINLLSAFYVSQKTAESEPLCVPVLYELILKTILLCIIKTKKTTRQSPVTKNELMQTMISQCIHNQLLFKYILADSWFSSADNMHFIAAKNKYFIFEIKDNRLAILAQKTDGQKPNKKAEWTNISELELPDNTPVKVWLKDMDFPVLLTKQVFKNEDKDFTGTRFLVSNDLSLSNSQFLDIYKKRWKVEEYHKSLKQNASIAKSPTHTVKTQTNHLYCALMAFVKLEKIKWATQLGHFQIKAKIYIKALRAAFKELAIIKQQEQPA
ncbi:MAG: transposase [Runella sp.]